MPPKEKLNIAMVCDPIGSNKSGVVVSTVRFAKLLRARGHHIIFIGAKLSEQDDSDHDSIKAYRYRSIPIPKGDGWCLSFPTVRELKKVFMDEKIDVVHIILPMSGAVVAIKAAQALKIPIVAHSHSQPENIFLEAPKWLQPTLGRLWNRYLVWVYSKAQTLIYPSEMAKSLLHNLGKKNQSSMVISNGINLSHFVTLPVGDFYKRFNIPEKAIKLLFVGRLHLEKSVDTLIKAMPYIIKTSKNIHLMIVGPGYLRPKLEKLTQSLGMQPYITFLGQVSEEDKIIAYNASDIFVLPSIAELEGMVVLEAMACSKPIVISDAKMSASRYFVDGNGFLFKTRDHQHLAEQVLKIIADPVLRKKMGEKSFQNAQKYDIHKSVELLEEVYYKAITTP
ncbi:glycosyltransferase [Candidatus Nomurabacteria bacterium]|nr:glycosyltransferase [Candidatus Nomurabacteria bacterium]